MFTSPPWTPENDFGENGDYKAPCVTIWAEVNGRKKKVATVYNDNCELLELTATTLLIAAAPDLLEACQTFVEAYTKSLQLEKADVAVRLAQQAIQKATGDT